MAFMKIMSLLAFITIGIFAYFFQGSFYLSNSRDLFLYSGLLFGIGILFGIMFGVEKHG